MDISTASVETLGDELERIVARIEDQCAKIAKELRKPPPVNSAGLMAPAQEITNTVRAFGAYFQRLTQAQRRESDRLQDTDGGRTILSLDWLRLNTRAGLVRTWLNQWPGIQSMLGEQMHATRRKLYNQPHPANSILRTQIDLSDRLLGTLNELVNPHGQSETARDSGCFPDISLPNSLFLEHVHAAYRVLLARQQAGSKSFLDVGCGGGLKVLTASALFDHAAGIEFDRGYVASARRLNRRLGTGAGRIIHSDARKFRGYGKYDVVYFYRPMRELDVMKKLERTMVEKVRPGTLLIAPYLGFHRRHADLGCAKIDGSLFLANANKTEAARLRRLAEYTGPHVKERNIRPGLPSIWQGVLDACHANGFGVETERATPW